MHSITIFLRSSNTKELLVKIIINRDKLKNINIIKQHLLNKHSYCYRQQKEQYKPQYLKIIILKPKKERNMFPSFRLQKSCSNAAISVQKLTLQAKINTPY